MNKNKISEKAMIDLITQIEVLVSYNNQLTLLDEIEKILTDEQKEVFQNARKNTIETKEC